MTTKGLSEGNLLLWTEAGELIEVEGILKGNIFYKGNYVPARLLTPIPLTKDLLISVGFNSMNSIEINEYFSLCIDGKKGKATLIYINGSLSIPNSVAHVHDLQNLYCDLKGKELIKK